MLDGRIHPSRIEEIYERSKGEVAELCLRAAEDAMAEVGITDLHRNWCARWGCCATGRRTGRTCSST